VLHIQDVYPESLLGKLPDFLRCVVAPPLIALDRSIARQASRVVAISENMRRTYVQSRGIPPERVVTVLNWVDEARFASLPLRRDACARYNVPEDRFTFLYLGNIGPVAGVELLIEAFQIAQLPKAQLVIVGDGSSKKDCVDLVRRLQVKGVQFISDPEAANVPLLQSLGHVCLLPVRKGAGMSSIPSKLMAYLLSGKPVLSTVDAASDTAKCIQEAQCGWVGEPENTKWLATKMAEIVAIPTIDLVEMGQRGRCYGLANYSKSVGVKRLAEVVIREGRRGFET
jgi:glycosyltransferase involved in cell wall biosynthesis